MVRDEVGYIVDGIVGFLKRRIGEHGGFGARSFYGESFTLALLAMRGELDNAAKEVLICSFDGIDKEDSQFHWEFNNYAFLHYLEYDCDEQIERLLKPLRFKGTGCTNWTLLRNRTRLLADPKDKQAVDESIVLLGIHQDVSGLIWDEPGVKSLQYHCFSLAMIGEISEVTGDVLLREAFCKGLQFIRRFILANGMSLYIGRGQEQIFGYSSLVYLLAQAVSFLDDTTIWNDIRRVVGYIRQFVRSDGGLPLVLRHGETYVPTIVDLFDKRTVGWYSYNNYFDYLPFCAFFLDKSYRLLEKMEEPIDVPQYTQGGDYSDRNFVCIRRDCYEAVMSCPGGYWTNDMAMPYIVKDGKALLPCYGGEQCHPSLYSVIDLAIPYVPAIGKSFRQKAWATIGPSTMLLVSPLGVVRRKYIFDEKVIRVCTRVYSPLPVRQPLVLFDSCRQLSSTEFECEECIIRTDTPVMFSREAYCAQGKCMVYETNNKNAEVRILL